MANRGGVEGAERIVMDRLTEKIIGAAIEVHKVLGPGLLESAYEECLAHELSLANICFERQVPLPITYKALPLDCGYRLDFLVERDSGLGTKNGGGVATDSPSAIVDLSETRRIGNWVAHQLQRAYA
jgi:hypothetical protein